MDGLLALLATIGLVSLFFLALKTTLALSMRFDRDLQRKPQAASRKPWLSVRPSPAP